MRPLQEIRAYAWLAATELCVKANQAALARAAQNLADALDARQQAHANVVCITTTPAVAPEVPRFLLKEQG